jgi:hypothetical protein
LLFLVGALGLLSGIVWWQLPALLNWSVTQSLQQYGLTKVTLQISEVGVSQASIDRLDVTYPDGDTTLRIELNQLSLDYTLSQLITGHAENLSVDSIVLTLDQQTSEQAGPSPTLPTIEHLIAAFKAADTRNFPLNTVRLPSISISHNLASESKTEFDTIELQAELSKHQNQLNTELLFANQQKINWTNDQDNGWNVHFFDAPVQDGVSQQPEPSQQHADLSQPAFKGSLNQVGQSLVFSAEIKPSLSQRWLASIEQAESSIELSDIALTGTISGNNPAPGLALISIIEIQNLGTQDWNIQTLNARFEVQIKQASATFDQSQESLQINVQSNNTLSLTRASLADWQVDNLTLNVSSDANFTQDVNRVSSPAFLLTVGKLQKNQGLELSDTSFSGAVSAHIDAEQWQIDVAESWQLASQYSRMDKTELPQGWAMTSTQPLHLKGDFQAAAQAALEATLLKITIPVVQDKTLEQRIQPLNLSLQIEQARFNQGSLYAAGLLAIPQLTINDIATNNKQENVWRLDNVNQSFKFSNNLLISHGSLQSSERNLHIETTSKHNFKSRQGSSEFRFKTLKFSDPGRLNQLTFPFVSPVNLVVGEVDLAGQARWYDKEGEWQTTVDIDAQLENLGGAYEQAYFSGTNGQLSLQVYPEIFSKTPQRMTVAQLDAGVENKDMVLEFILRPSTFGDLPIVDILQAQTQLLQGSVSLKQTAYDLNQSQQNLQVVLENIDLNELVTLQQLDDVQATGLINGLLPITINNGQISIDDGQLQAIAPGGVLKYQADTDALLSNKVAETVVLALRNFHYDVLRADTQYKPDGTLLLKLQLQGNNPAFEQGRQVKLNINLEQNVLKLLESLRLYDGVSDRLDKQVRDLYQQTK